MRNLSLPAKSLALVRGMEKSFLIENIILQED